MTQLTRASKSVTRRTQADRKASTIALLLAAATDALIELGYAGASVQQICQRAGVSQGGLFRHFPTRETLMVAVAADASASVLASYRTTYTKKSRSADPLRLALSLLRAACRSRANQAWYELALAARTDTALRDAIAPLAASYYDAIRTLARALLPDHAAALGPRFDVLVDTLVATFDGEQMQRFMNPRLVRDEPRLDLLHSLVSALV